MTSLNQQIAEELGYFIATDEDWHDLIHICLCNVDGDEQIEIDTFYWFHPSSETPPESLYENIWSKTPDWENNQNEMVRLLIHPLPAPEGEEDKLWWNLEYADDTYMAYVYNEYGSGYEYDDNSASTALCKAWLVCARTNREYWKSQWKER